MDLDHNKAAAASAEPNPVGSWRPVFPAMAGRMDAVRRSRFRPDIVKSAPGQTAHRADYCCERSGTGPNHRHGLCRAGDDRTCRGGTGGHAGNGQRASLERDAGAMGGRGVWPADTDSLSIRFLGTVKGVPPFLPFADDCEIAAIFHIIRLMRYTGSPRIEK